MILLARVRHLISYMTKFQEGTDLAFWPALRRMHLYDSLWFDTRYDIMSWPEGFADLVRFCEGAESLEPKTSLAFRRQMWPPGSAAPVDLVGRGPSSLIIES